MSPSAAKSSSSQPCGSYLARIEKEMSYIEDLILDLLSIPHGQPSMSVHAIFPSSLSLYYDKDQTSFSSNLRAGYSHLRDQWMTLALAQLIPDHKNVPSLDVQQKSVPISTSKSSGPEPCKTYLARIKQEMSDIEDLIVDLLRIPEGQPSMSARKIQSPSLLLYYDEDRTCFYNNVRAGYGHLQDQWMILALAQLNPNDEKLLEALRLDVQTTVQGKEIQANRAMKAEDQKNDNKGTKVVVHRTFQEKKEKGEEEEEEEGEEDADAVVQLNKVYQLIAQDICSNLLELVRAGVRRHKDESAIKPSSSMSLQDNDGRATTSHFLIENFPLPLEVDDDAAA